MPIVRFFSILGLIFFAGLLLPATQAGDNKRQRPAQWATPVGTQYNLNQMTPTLYRSTLPDSNALPILTRLNITTVINFLPEADSSWLSDPGIKQVQLPYRISHIDDADVLTVLRAIKDAEDRGSVLIHDKQGTERTGLMAAMYRVVVQGWSKEEALSEMMMGGFDGSSYFKDSIRYMMQAPVDKLREALASGACSTSPYATCNVQNWVKSADKP
ncbi:dual specificity protein phosphatase family protein [Pseudomonas gingeri]|uniref:Dual specificity protein phosphatase family protein n=1 Tax=Pseudomonas gingeri TaxID=117681 RepID=A0A7Y8C0Y0_9PSED|nr:dual specificity protein phosphatase family protein [Pseudomonas gingeri]NWA28126.1 dual specificity protein phosphatase family protein [Pseudomonas gingeri]NWB95895.1 dual specificity protein phosphatase family protein [Pseudomonas gingeri]NWD69085.1 dual specificity protein phosphatase family protein [Pseudomonas gingeri]NWD76228.1 dual specificity protein phosphatase family protein [Pseudomonas gingeri]